jgi:hypothetical protein
MVELADHDQHPPRTILRGELPAHAEAFGKAGEVLPQLLARGAIGIESNPHEKAVITLVIAAIVELLSIEDIAPALEQECRNPRRNSGLVGATERQD